MDPEVRAGPAVEERAVCPACGATEVSVFYEVVDVPAHSCVLTPTREQAFGYPTGDVRLGFCASCGFIFNVAFDPALLDYSQDYEETQGFSPRFNAFARSLAERLIERHGLRGKEILEIGCGKGEFLGLLCQLGDNQGIGIDPSYVPERTPREVAQRVTFIRDYFTPRYAHLRADLVCCRHTLEHIADVGGFVDLVRLTVQDRPDTVVFFEVPDVGRVLRELAFWDVYHEHCSYFSPGSLARLFRSRGFCVLDLWKDFDDQYLLLESRLGATGRGRPLPTEEPLEDLAREVGRFRRRHREGIDRWRAELERIRERGLRAVVWGSGSKGVAFLTTLGAVEEIRYVVDINPFRAGMFMPGTGQEIVPPEFLAGYRPDLVIVMNPVYQDEIRGDLERMGLSPEMTTVEAVALGVPAGEGRP